MPPIDPNKNRAVKKPPKRYGAVGRGADTAAQPRRAGPPAPKPKPRPIVKPAPKRPAPSTSTALTAPPLRAPFARQGQQEQRRVDTARRKLPTPTVAAPPVISRPGPKAKPAPGGKPMSRAEVQKFLASQSKQAVGARRQIVTSIRTNVKGLKGAERVEAIGRLMDEIATDPKLAGTRKAIRHWSAVEASTARPQTRATAKPGPKDKKIGIKAGPISANINLTAATDVAVRAAKAATPGLQQPDGPGRFTRNALKDFRDLPLMVPTLIKEAGHAALDASGGDTKRAKRLAESFTEGVYGNVVKGDWEGLADYLIDHPVFAALEVRGGPGLVGRGAGAAMRSGAFGTKAQRAASTARPDLNLSGSGARVADRRHYSPNVITKGVQVAFDKSRGANRNKPVLGDHRLRRRADFESDTAAATSRAVRVDEARSARKAKPKGPLAEVVGLVTQGVVRQRTVVADLRKELARLDAAHAAGGFSTGAQKRQNRTTAANIRKVLDSPAAIARIDELAASGRANVRAINDLEAQAGRLGAITSERAERAALFPGAQAHAGAKYGDAPFKGARGREVAAGRALRAERTRLSQRVTQAKKTETDAQAKVKTLAAQYKVERGREGHNAPIAAYHVGGQRFMLRKEAVDHAKAAGIPLRQIKRLALTGSEAKRVGELSRARRAAQGAAAHRRAAEADLRALNKRGASAVPARQAFETARGQRIAAQKGGTQTLHAVDQQGNPLPLSNDTIKRAIGQEVAYLPHHTKQRGARAHYQTAFAGRKNLDASGTRTGAAFEKGAVDVSYQAVAEHRIRMRGVVNRIAEHDQIIHSIAIKGPDGKMMTWDQATRMAENAADRGAKLVPYRAVPGSYDKARMATITNAQNAADIPDLAAMIGHEFEARLKQPAAGDKSARNVVLVPEEIINQLKEQQRVSSSAGKVGNVAADVFRRTVLPFSTKWLVGNILEAGVRLSAVGAGPNSRRIGKNLLKEIERLDKDQAIRVRAALTGGLLYGNKGLTVRRVSEHFEGTAFAKPAAAVSVAGQLPVIRQLGQGMVKYTDGVFAFNRSIEQFAQQAALGKWAKREMQEMTGSWAKATRAQERALQDLAKGMTDSKNIHDAARYIDQTLGQYSRFSPHMRRLIQSATPFLPWYVNAARFVYWTLPAKHPIKTSMAALVAQNLQDDFEASHKDVPPGTLKSAIPMGDGKYLDMARYSPFGLHAEVAGGDDGALTNLVDPFFPQFKSAALAAFGLNFAGRRATIDPRDRGDTPSIPLAVRVSMAVNSLAEAFVPGVSILKRIEEGGSTGYDNSNVLRPRTKPGTDVPGGAANRILNPFRPTQLRADAGKVAPAPKRAPAPAPTLEDELLDNLDQSLGDAEAQQALEDELLENLYGGG